MFDSFDKKLTTSEFRACTCDVCISRHFNFTVMYFIRFQDLVGSISAPILDNIDGEDLVVDQDAIEVSN